MTTTNLEAGFGSDAERVATLPVDIAAASLAEELEEAMAAPQRRSLETLRYQLEVLYLDAFERAPHVVKAAVKTPRESSELRCALRLGELKFAQLVAAQAERRRSSDSFQDLMTSGINKRIVEVLRDQRLSNKELAERLDVSQEHIGRVMPRLREEGVTEFVRKGTCMVNFLTPVASVVLSNLQSEQEAADEVRSVTSYLKSLEAQTAGVFREFPDFGSRSDRVLDTV